MCPEPECGFSCRQLKVLNQHLAMSHNKHLATSHIRKEENDESEWENEEGLLDQTNGKVKLKRSKAITILHMSLPFLVATSEHDRMATWVSEGEFYQYLRKVFCFFK